MRRDGPELPGGQPRPEDEERGFLWPPTPGELALCVLLFILFFAFSWGLVLWDVKGVHKTYHCGGRIVYHRRDERGPYGTWSGDCLGAIEDSAGVS